MFDLSISLVNNDFQINKCTTILEVDERLCYVLPILSIPYFTITSYNRVILSIKFFSYDFVTIKWMDSNGKLYFRNVSHFDWTKTGKFPELTQLNHGVYS